MEISELESTPPNIIEAANNTRANLLPEKLKEKYQIVYNLIVQ